MTPQEIWIFRKYSFAWPKLEQQATQGFKTHNTLIFFLSFADPSFVVTWCDKFEIYGNPDEVFFLSKNVLCQNQSTTVDISQKREHPEICSAARHLPSFKHYVKRSIFCTIEVAMSVNFDLYVRTKTPTHDFSPYFFLHFLSIYEGGWVNIETKVGEYNGKNMSSLEHTFLHEALPDHVGNLSSKTLKSDRDHFMLFQAKVKHISTPVTLTANLMATFLSKTSNKFELRNVLRCTITSRWRPFLQWMTLEEKKALSLTFVRNVKYRILSIGGSLSSLMFNVSNNFRKHKVNLYWIHGSFADFLHYSSLEPKECNLHANVIGKCDYCLKFPSSFQQNYMFFKSHHVEELKIQSKRLIKVKLNKRLKSWTQSSKICKNVGGVLPTYNSREELNEFVALIKLSPYLPPVDVVYVGIQQTTKVRNTEIIVNTRGAPALRRRL